LNSIDEDLKERRNIYILVKNKKMLKSFLNVLNTLDYCENYDLWTDYYLDVCMNRKVLLLQIITSRRIVKSPESYKKIEYTEAKRYGRVLIDLDYYKLTGPKLKLNLNR
jgi:hypothetical protein